MQVVTFIALVAAVIFLIGVPAALGDFERGQCRCDSMTCYFFCEDPFPSYRIHSSPGHPAQCVERPNGCNEHNCQCEDPIDCYCCDRAPSSALGCGQSDPPSHPQERIEYCCKDRL